jgi:cytochrome c oxidase assembly factor CtaG
MYLSAEAVVLVPLLALGYALLARLERPSRARFAAATAALALIFVAFVTELQELALHTFLWAHLLQNVVLAEWAPALLVLAVPAGLARRASGFVLFRPLVALPLWIVVYLAWHLPWLYDYALRHPHSVLHVEHVSYLAAGIAVWWPVIHGRYSAGAKALYMFAAFVLASPLGLVLALIPSPIYAFYENAPRTWGPGPLGDQQLAGVTMAVEQAVVFAAVFAAFLRRFFAEEQLDGVYDDLRTSQARDRRRAAAGSARPRR